MTRKHYFLLFLISLLVRGGVAWLQKSPGFMDAEYYYIGGAALARGEGFTEQILWNYLDDPAGLPHPSHGYWMPLTSILAGLGMFITQSQGFAAAQWVFVLVSSLIPPLTAFLSFQLTQNRSSALLAGGVAIFAAFYLPYLSTTDTFGLYAVLGALFFILLSIPFKKTTFPLPVLLGCIAGLMHLSRADGIMWLGFAWIGVIFTPVAQPEKFHFNDVLKKSIWVLGGYFAVMGPWLLRNFQIFESALAPGGWRSLWITSYDELFIYPASQLTPERWISSGISAILEARLWALGINLQRSLAEQGMIFLTPLILLGIWDQRRDFRIRLAVFIWLCTFFVMTVVFPYQGARGGFFHSSAALLPILWAVVPIGLNCMLRWANRLRGWNVREARMVFSGAILIFAILLSAFTVTAKLVGKNGAVPQWEENQVVYQNLESALLSLGASPKDIVMTIDAPGYFAYALRDAIAIPDGNTQTTLEVAQKYGGRYLLLEKSHPRGLNDLYDNPDSGFPELQFLISVNGTHIFLANRHFNN